MDAFREREEISSEKALEVKSGIVSRTFSGGRKGMDFRSQYSNKKEKVSRAKKKRRWN